MNGEKPYRSIVLAKGDQSSRMPTARIRATGLALEETRQRRGSLSQSRFPKPTRVSESQGVAGHIVSKLSKWPPCGKEGGPVKAERT